MNNNNMDNYSNKLISQYNNYQYNPQNNQNQLNEFKIQQMQQMQQMQELKKLEKINQLEKTFDKEKLKQIIINPQKITKSNQEILEKWTELKKKYENDVNIYWKDRDNKPYKNILKNEDYTKKIESVKDLIVHRVTVNDKQGVDQEYKQLQEKLEKQNNEFKIIYSTSNQNEHKKKFDYNHVYKFKMNFDPKNDNESKPDHDSMKQNQIEYYKNQQKQMEEQKQKKDQIIESLIKDGIFNENELLSANILKHEDDNKYEKKSKKEKYLERQSKK